MTKQTHTKKWVVEIILEIWGNLAVVYITVSESMVLNLVTKTGWTTVDTRQQLDGKRQEEGDMS